VSQTASSISSPISPSRPLTSAADTGVGGGSSDIPSPQQQNQQRQRQTPPVQLPPSSHQQQQKPPTKATAIASPGSKPTGPSPGDGAMVPSKTAPQTSSSSLHRTPAINALMAAKSQTLARGFVSNKTASGRSLGSLGHYSMDWNNADSGEVSSPAPPSGASVGPSNLGTKIHIAKMALLDAEKAALVILLPYFFTLCLYAMYV